MDPDYLLENLFRRWDRQHPVSREDKEALLALPWSYRTFARDAYLVREGDRTSVCTLLVSGLAYRQKLVKDGSRQIVSFHIPGEFLDIQNSMFEVADHNVQALSRISVAAIQKTALTQLMADRPGVRKAIWVDNLVDASIFREWVVNVGRRDARGRIAHLLCELAARLNSSAASDGHVYDFPLTQEQIADATGLTSVHTNRTLQSLRKDGLISLSSSRLTILDWDALSEVGDFNERYLHHSM